jgi:hypothetical protein
MASSARLGFIVVYLAACSTKADGTPVGATDGGVVPDADTDAGVDADGGTDGGAGGDGGVALPCAVSPDKDGHCPPERPGEIFGNAIDIDRHCQLTHHDVVGCTPPGYGSIGIHTCHVHVATGTVYDVIVDTCMPAGWRDCTATEAEAFDDPSIKPCP